MAGKKAFLVVGAFLLGSIAGAQTSEMPSVETPKIGSRLELVAPYSGWKDHVGKPEECLAVFQIEQSPDAPVIYQTGIVVRCDGFILAPISVYDALGKPGWKVRVTLSGAEGVRLTEPLPIAGKPPHRSHRALTHVVKVSDYHMKSARLLAPANLKPGMAVRVLSAIPERGGLSRAVHAGTLGQAGEKDAWSLEFGEKAAPDVLEPGAVVVDAESGGVVGMVTQGGGAPFSFSTLAYFSDNCGEVALCPDRDAVALKKPTSKDMVLVKGGPIPVMDKDYQARYQTDVACTPDFYCDTKLMSVGRYQKWMGTKKSVPLPASWILHQAPLHPSGFPNWPVTGVRPEEIRWLAADLGKRLLTWVEWERAAYSPDLSWLTEDELTQQVIQEIDLADYTFEQKVKIHEDKKNGSGTVIAAMGAAVRGNPPAAAALVADQRENMARMTQEWVGQLREALKKLFPGAGQVGGFLRGPGWPHEIGMEADDKSVWGVTDVVTNVPELVLDRGMTARTVGKIAGARLDPFLTIVQWTGNALVGGGSRLTLLVGLAEGSASQAYLANVPLEDPLFWRLVFNARLGARQYVSITDVNPFGGEGGGGIASLSRSYDVIPRALPGFRLAR
jgi:formylglycine-generating enzyme required for sulfatase activity